MKFCFVIAMSLFLLLPSLAHGQEPELAVEKEYRLAVLSAKQIYEDQLWQAQDKVIAKLRPAFVVVDHGKDFPPLNKNKDEIKRIEDSDLTAVAAPEAKTAYQSALQASKDKLLAALQAAAQTPSPAEGDQNTEALKKRIAAVEATDPIELAKQTEVKPEKTEGPAPEFFGVPVKSRRVIYMIDRAGWMIDNLDAVRQELKRSIGALRQDQFFAIVTFDEDPHILGPKMLVRATPEAKQQFNDIIDKIHAAGEGIEPLYPFLDSFQTAINLRPNTIYFLNSHAFDPKLIDKVAELNAEKKVCINTVEFVVHDSRLEALMKRIALDNGGTYKFIEENDLGKK